MTEPPVSLRLFGGVSLERNGRPVSGRATQRRRLGVLGLLAAAPTGQVSRDRLIALLWPEAGTEAARHLLTGAVYELRKALGEDAIISRGDELGLNSDVVSCDSIGFERNLAEGALEQAVALYRGAFADGLHVSQAEEFERWLEETRSRYRSAWRKALATLAEARQRAGQLEMASQHWTTLAESDPADGSVVARAAECLVLAGQPAPALRLCHLHASAARRELGSEPDPRVSALARQIVDGHADAPAVPASIEPRYHSSGLTSSASRNRVGQAALWAIAGAAALLLVALTRDDGAHADVLPSDRLTAIASEGTQSRPALQAWLLGEREYRNGHFLAASEYFARAAETDSNFALAFYRLSQSRLAADLPEADASKADRRLEQLAPHLAERERLLVAAYSGFRIGNAEYAEQRYQGLTTHFDNDLEAWLQLGETRFHYGPMRGVPLLASLPAFEKAVSLDPGNWNANWHLASLAALDGKRAESVAAIDRLLSLSPEGSQRLELELLKAIAQQNEPATNAIVLRLRDADELMLFQIAWRTAVFFRNFAVAERVAGMLVEAGRPTYSQMIGRLSLAHLRLAVGDAGAAREHMLAANSLPGTEGYVRTVRAATALLPMSLWSRKEIEAFRDTLQTTLPRTPEPYAPRYIMMIGALSAALGQPDSAAKVADLLQRDGYDNWAGLLRAEVASRVGDYEEVLTQLRNRGPVGWYGNVVSSLGGFEGRIRFLRAEALYHTGRLEEALGWYGSLGEHALSDLGYWPAAQERRQEILTRLSKSPSPERLSVVR